jgi:hypothetical protein
VNIHLSEKRFLLTSVIITSYFALVYLFYILEFEPVIVGVLRELLTIPFFIAQLFFLVMGMIMLLRNAVEKKAPVITGVILLLTSTLLITGSFMFSN